MRVLLLGGTGEGRALAQLLVAGGIDVISSLAGRTTDARLPVGTVRTGGFGGADGLTDWLRTNPVDAIIDATHPFATSITANATEAAAATGTRHLILRRPGWTPTTGDTWHWAETHNQAATLLPTLGTRPFLTIGRQNLPAFAPTTHATPVTAQPWVLARCVDPPEPPPTWCTLLLARGPFTHADELAILREHRIDLLVTKDSGGPATAPKLKAARQLRIPVLIIRRPPLPRDAQSVPSPEAALAWTLRT
ncbi:cobalt-precorrin-6A reductase [Kribbella solani]|uniref:Precorrin-6A/cobalt-precorrin-6A reductase n=1 Tax=Kribbella solani TaxID=236067 RepID=A0A841DZ33_9ACTN|nr:cobalt-precorrin-6A reductase [Kribbella solani]MBB5983892.1 precorrin-6A/cobalt-precorrin-6A reductase [Kribbella solani]MDX2968239.1 cobalt-precorrin-6A reductase [Kribbella solani]MDX3006457.1 cobalt-precorrin-6A reductase [Kribbella solani]